MALVTCEFIWLKQFGATLLMTLICDNKKQLHIASNPIFHEMTKHIEIYCYFIREIIAS